MSRKKLLRQNSASGKTRRRLKVGVATVVALTLFAGWSTAIFSTTFG